MRSSSPFMSTFATEMVVRGHRSLREVRWFFRNRLVEVACLFARYWLFLIVFYCWRINIFPIRMFSSVRSSDCDSDRILESNQKNSKNQSIHLFWLLGEREGSSSDCFHLNDFYFSLQLGILSLQLINLRNKKYNIKKATARSLVWLCIPRIGKGDGFSWR